MRRHRPTGGVQMFSFLDAMVCTMGALLVLVHAFARHGEVEATQRAEARTSSGDELDADRESLEWRIAQLNEARSKTQAQLEEARLQLSHIEDHQRRLLARLDELKLAAKELDRVSTTQSRERETVLAELNALQAKLREAREALAAQQQAEQATSYSVVPYDGPNGTRRRPIYIECRADSMILQPEGIELKPEDFSGIAGPGNPLASALRGIREYWARQSPPAAGKQAEEPYPLLLVRPEGIASYYFARSALESWGADFGYEMIGSDWRLKFSEPDLRLSAEIKPIVDDARERMRELFVATRQFEKNRHRTALHASSRGGFVTERGRGGGGRGSGVERGGWDTLGTNWARGGGTGSGGSSGSGNGGSHAGSRGSLAGGGSLAQGSSGSGPGGFASSQSSGGEMEGASNGGGFKSGSSPSAGGMSGSSSVNSSMSSSVAQNDRYGGGGRGGAQDSAGAGQHSGEGGIGEPAANADGGSGATQGDRYSSSGTQSGDRYSSKTGSGGQGSPYDTASQQSGGSSGDSGSSQSAGGSGGTASPGGSSPPSSVSMGAPSFGKQQGKKTSSMANTRGRDWGLPESGSGTAAVDRPIALECHNDRLLILPDGGRGIPKEVPLGDKTQASVDELVSDVWQHMKGWGTAGRGMYWRPTLVMDVKPGAADRYAELKALLADSGLDVQERKPPATAQQPTSKAIRKR